MRKSGAWTARLLFVSLLAISLAVSSHVAALRSQSRPPEQSSVLTADGLEAVPGEVLVQFARVLPASVHQNLARYVDAAENRPVGRKGLHRIRSRSFDLDTLLAFFAGQRDVVFAEPNYVLRTMRVPDDPGFGNLWGLLNTGQSIAGYVGSPGADIRAPLAWDVSTGSRGHVVGVVDSGIDYTHPDLTANIWSAPASFTVTIGGVSMTCPAGSHGFNAISRTCDPMDDNNHGTHVAGTIGAAGNNGRGVTGVNWVASIIGGKFLDAGGVGSTSRAIDTIDFMIQAKTAFAATRGANIRILNNSWGGGGYSTALLNAIREAETNDMLFVAAAGNDGSNNDLVPKYPASYDAANVIAVAATDSHDSLSAFSNFGASSVHLAAPGSLILSTTVGGSYRYMSGTSMAAPHVSGAAALLLSACSYDTPSLLATLLESVDVLGSLTGLLVTNGRLNVDRAIRGCAPPRPPPAPTGLQAIASSRQVVLTWFPAAGAASYRIQRSESSGGPYSVIAAAVVPTTYTDTGLINDVTYYYTIAAQNAAGTSAESAEVAVTPRAGIPAAPAKLKATAGDRRVTLRWQTSFDADEYRVKRATAKAGPYSTVATTAATTATDTAVTNGVKYFYIVTAVNGAGESGRSNKASAMPAPVPPAPTGVTAVPGPRPGEIVVSWEASPWADRYKVRRSLTEGGPYGSAVKTTASPATITGLASGSLYYFVVSAVNGTGESAPSTPAAATAP